jgi:P-type Cu2+ transporter
MIIQIENMINSQSIKVVRQQFELAGLTPVKVSIGTVELAQQPDSKQFGQLVNLLKHKGYKMNTLKKQFPVIGMTCASCSARVENTLNNQSGVVQASVNLASQIAQVEYLGTIVQPEKLKEKIQSAGYDLIIEETENTREETENLHQKIYQNLKRRTVWAIVLAIPLMIIGMFFMDMPLANYIQWVIATPVLTIFGRSFFINAWKQARHRSANMDSLVALSTGIAYLFSIFNTLFPEFWHSRGLHAHVYFEASGVVIAFILLGKFLEEKAKAKTSYAIKKLMGLQPNMVTLVLSSGETMEIPIARVKQADILLVKPGDKIPVDGKVTEGRSYVDESLITGEPVPVFKEQGAQVFAGTVNQQGSFQLSAEKVGAETLLSSIIRLVQEAQGSKAPVQKLVDKVAGIFVPVVVLISVITLIAWSILGGENGTVQGILSMVTVLVIACPCALGLATPTAIMVGIGKGAEQNILIKDAEVLELSYKLNAIVLDKTGTITEGKPSVDNIQWKEGKYTDENRNILFNLERTSEHPLAGAVVSFLKNESAWLSLPDIINYPGKGISGDFNNNRYYAGSEKLMSENNISVGEKMDELTGQWEKQAKTVVYFSDGKEVLAVIAITDKIHESAADSIREFEKAGIEVYMLTGDNRKTAEAVATKIGLKNYRAEMLPSEKASFIVDLQQKGKIVGMVGDGINDSQALAIADVSIAMGKGSDIAIDAAKMTIIGSNLAVIPVAIRLSRNTVQTIKQNLFWAFIYNVIGIPIAAGVLFPVNGFLLNPMIAGAAMALSSVSVVSNSLRLKWRS